VGVFKLWKSVRHDSTKIEKGFDLDNVPKIGLGNGNCFVKAGDEGDFIMKNKVPGNNISRMWMKYRRDLFASLALAVTIFFFAPLSAYVENADRLNLNLLDIFFLYILITFIAFIILASCNFLSQNIFPKVSVIYFTVSFCFLIQGTLLTYNLGNMDGHVIQWSAFQNYYLLEFIVWGVSIFAAILYRKQLFKNLNFGIALLIFAELSILLGTSVLNRVRENPAINNSSLTVNYQREFEFSSDKNVVIIIIDTFRSTAFNDALNKKPGLNESFKDFTFYENTVSNFPNTYASIPSILTGIPYNNQTTTSEYLGTVFPQSLPVLLSQHGFDVELYPYNSTTLVSYPNVWDNISKTSSSEEMRLQSLYYPMEKLGLLTLIRYSPLVLKPFFVNRFYSISENNLQEKAESKNPVLQFYENSNLIKRTGRVSVFKFIHLPGVHPPYVIDDTLSLGEYPYNYDSYVNQAVANLAAVSNFLEKMKETGAYNNTLIIIMGDHGIQPFLQEYPSTELTIKNRPFFINNYLPYVGNPLLLVKDFNQKQARTLNSKEPVILSDVPKMISEELNIKNNFGGFNPLAMDIPQDRKRYFYFYDSAAHNWGSSYMPTLFEYVIQGPADDVRSWTYTGKVYKPGKIESYSLPIYNYGDNIIEGDLFHQFASFISDGFFNDEKHSAWALGPISCLHLPVEKNDKPLSLSFSVSPFLEKGQLPEQELNILADDQLIKSIQLKGDISLKTILPINPANDKELDLCFEFPDAIYSPKDLGLSEDIRHLGGLFRSIIINEIDSYSLPAKINFSNNGNVAVIQRDGWSDPESEFTWTNGKNAELLLPITIEKTKNLKLIVSAFPFIYGDGLKQQLVTVRSDGAELGRWAIDRDGEYAVDIPPEHIKDGILSIEFEIPNAASPASLGLSEDTRLLGMAVRRIRVEEVVPYSLPVKFDFSKNSNVASIKGTGWSNSEPEFTWTDGINVQLFIPLVTDGAENLKMILSAFPLTYGEELSQQLVIVRSNGVELGRWKMDHDGEYSVSIPSDFVENGLLNIEFELPNATSPSGLGMSQDPRNLGMAVRWIRLEK
jgi:hypothetical protein